MNNIKLSLDRMQLNSQNMGDEDFTTNISYIVEEYIYDDTPKQYTFNTLQKAIIKAYDLFLVDNLHSIGIYDKKNKRYHLTDALNYFVDSNYIELLREKEQLVKELETYKQFIKTNKAEKLFEEFKQSKEEKQ